MSPLLTYGPFTVDLDNRTIERDGLPIVLPPKVFDTFAALLANAGRVVTKDELMRAVWPDTFVDEANLTQNIFTLRRALAADDGRTWIETVPRRGYRLTAPVEQLARASASREALIVETRETIHVVREEDDRPRRPWSRALVLGVAVVAFLAAVIGGVIGYRFREPDRLDRLEVRRLTTSGDVVDAAVSPDGRFVAYVLRDESGWSILLRQVATSSNVRIVEPEPVQLGGVTFTPDGEHVTYLRGVTGATALYRVSTLGGVAQRVLDDVRSPVTFSPDGARFAFVRWFPDGGAQGLMVANADGSDVRTVTLWKRPEIIAYEGPSWSPTGDRVAMIVNESFGGTAPRLVETTIADGATREISKELEPSAGKVAWLPDGSGLVVASDQLWLYPYPSGPRRRVTNDAASYAAVSVSRDGRRIVAERLDLMTSVWIAPGAVPGGGKRIATGSGVNNGVSLFADGRVVFLATTEGDVDLWISDLEGRNAKQLTFTRGTDNHPSVCGDRAIVLASARAGGSTIWRIDPDGGNPKQISGEGAHYGLECSNDGSFLVFHKADPKSAWTVWRMQIDGTEARKLTERPATFGTISPDGRAIAFNYLPAGASRDEWVVAVVPADGSGQPRILGAPGLPTRRMRWAPDGRSVVVVERRSGVDNLAALPLDGGPLVALTNFTDSNIMMFDWSPDGRHIGIVRSRDVRDVVMISGFR